MVVYIVEGDNKELSWMADDSGVSHDLVLA
jgi:hypothetical protein